MDLLVILHLYQHLMKISHFGRAKTSGLNDRKQVHIDLILTCLRSFNRENFRAGQNVKFSLDAGISGAIHLLGFVGPLAFFKVTLAFWQELLFLLRSSF